MNHAPPTVDERVRAAIDAACTAQLRLRAVHGAAGVLAGASVSMAARVVWPHLDPLHVALAPLLAVAVVVYAWVRAERAAEQAARACDVVEVDTPHGVVVIDPEGVT